ncbi:MAG: hypothetical protein ACPG4X_16890 [Pikeienuella sp.]
MSKWNLIKVMQIGAIAGFVYAAASSLMNGTFGSPVAGFVGYLIGSAIGGALLFGVVGFVRNLFAR